MCWSAEVSLKTFLFSGSVFILAFILHIFKVKILILYFYFILMQLIEFFLWRNLNDKEWNHLFSYMAFLLLTIHPLAFTLIVSDSNIQMYFIFLYIFFLSFTLYIHETEKIDYSVSVAKNGHLSWLWVKKYWKSYFVYILFFFVLLIEKFYITFIIILATYIYSMVSYYNEGTFSSMWCWSSNILGILILMRIIYTIYNMK